MFLRVVTTEPRPSVATPIRLSPVLVVDRVTMNALPFGAYISLPGEVGLPAPRARPVPTSDGLRRYWPRRSTSVVAFTDTKLLIRP